jgi:hypothetical protein
VRGLTGVFCFRVLAVRLIWRVDPSGFWRQSADNSAERVAGQMALGLESTLNGLLIDLPRPLFYLHFKGWPGKNPSRQNHGDRQ